jgi:glycosyltransferase involved in cell wall biosynthesis
MRIAFDAKRYFHNKTGLGNYSRKAVHALSTYFPDNEYFLCDSKPYESDMKVLPNCSLIMPENKAMPDAFWRSYSIVTDLVKKKIDVFHGLSNEIPLSMPVAGIKSVVTIHDVIYKLYPHYYPLIDRLIYDKKVELACKKANRIIATSHQTKSDLTIYYNVDPDKIDVVYQSVVMPEVSEADHELNKQKFGLDVAYLLYVGRVEERKNLLNCLKAFKELNRTDLHFKVVGNGGSYKEACEAYAKEHLAGRVIFYENISNRELTSFYKYSVALVFASYYEGFGIPILEAQMMRVPVITSQYGCFQEIGSVAACYVKPDDIESIAEGMQKITEDSSYRLELQACGLENVKRFSPQQFATDLMQVYHALFDNK